MIFSLFFFFFFLFFNFLILSAYVEQAARTILGLELLGGGCCS